MEYTQRPAEPTGSRRHKRIDWQGRAVRIEWFVFTALVALVLLVAIGWFIFSDNSTSNGESKEINTSKYQSS
jgi:hypothetical protein